MPASPDAPDAPTVEPRTLPTDQRHTITVPFEVTGVDGPEEVRVDPSGEPPLRASYQARTTTPASTDALRQRIQWRFRDAVNQNWFPDAREPLPEARGTGMSVRIPVAWAGKQLRVSAYVTTERRDRSAVTRILLTAPYLRYDGRELCWYSERNQVVRSWPMPGAPTWVTRHPGPAAGKWRVQVTGTALRLTPWTPAAAAAPSTIALGAQLPSFARFYAAAATKPALLVADYSEDLWVTADDLRRIFSLSDANLTKYLLPFNRMLRRYEIDTPLRQAHLLAQVGHESKQMTDVIEDSSGDQYEPNLPRGRTVGNTQPGDGRRFKGRGMIQLTGRGKYLEYGRYRGIDLVNGTNSGQVADDPELATDVAGWFWTYGKEKTTPGSVRFNLLADQDDIRTITLYVNGGYNGMEDRERHLRRAREVLGA